MVETGLVFTLNHTLSRSFTDLAWISLVPLLGVVFGGAVMCDVHYQAGEVAIYATLFWSQGHCEPHSEMQTPRTLLILCIQMGFTQLLAGFHLHQVGAVIITPRMSRGWTHSLIGVILNDVKRQ